MVYDPNVFNVLQTGLDDSEDANRCFLTQILKTSMMILLPYL